MLSSKNFAYSRFFSSLNKLFRMGGWVAGESGYKAISASTGAGAVVELGNTHPNVTLNID